MLPFRRDRWSEPTVKPHFARSFADVDPFSGYAGKKYAISELGFDRAEIVQFLDRQGIPHRLQASSGRQSDAADCAGEASNAGSAAQPSTERAVSTQPVAYTTNVHGSNVEPSVGRTVHKSDDRMRENRLDTLIDEAIRQANTHVTFHVWLRLKELALSGMKPFTGGIHDGRDNEKLKGGLIYDPGHGKSVDALTERRLDSRLIRRWKSLGNELPRR
jgi:hypothetical protein